MSDAAPDHPSSTLDEVCAHMSERRRQLREHECEAARADADAAIDAVEANFAAASAWVTAREQAYVAVEPVIQLSLVEFLR